MQSEMAHRFTTWHHLGALVASFTFDITRAGFLSLLILIFRLAARPNDTLGAASSDYAVEGRRIQAFIHDINANSILSLVNEARRFVHEEQCVWPEGGGGSVFNDWASMPNAHFRNVHLEGSGEPPTPEGGGVYLELKKLQLIKQVRVAHGIGLREAKFAIEDMLRRAVKPVTVIPVTVKPQSRFVHLKSNHLLLDELISLPKDWRRAVDPGMNADFDDRDEALYAPDEWLVLEWYWKNVLTFEQQKLFRNMNHFIETSDADVLDVTWYNKEGLSLPAAFIGEELIAE